MTAKWRPAGPEDIRRVQWTRPRQPRAEEIEADGKRLVTVRKAADLAGVATQTVYKWIRGGDLSHYRSRNGKWIRIDLEELRDFCSTPAHPREPTRA